MFEHIRKQFPWRTRTKRKLKEKFVRKLQEPGHGSPKIRFKDSSKIPAGAIILLQDYSDGGMTNAIYTGSGNWMMFGNHPTKNATARPTTMTTTEFEDLLTEKRNKATAIDKFLILDTNLLLNIDYSKHPSNVNFSKVLWHEIGNDEDE